MIIDRPRPEDIPLLRRLWQRSFWDTDEFLDSFFRLGFDPRRCRCVFADDQPVAALYWFDCACDGRKLAYLYAVATDEAHRGQGLCRALMTHIHELLKQAGYSAAVLVPGQPSLFGFYGNLGYSPFGGVRRWEVTAANEAVALRPVDQEEYAALRRQLLPKNGVIQEGAFLSVLADQLNLYAGDGFVFSAAVDNNRLIVQEYLGDLRFAPGILAALGLKIGIFRTPGSESPFAMALSLDGVPLPEYFGLALD